MVDLSFKPVTRFLAKLCLFLFLSACQGSLDASVVNSGFDSVSQTRPTGWFVSDAAAGKGTIEVLGGTNPVLSLTPNAQNTGGDDPLGVGQALDATSWHGTVLQLSADIAAEGGAAAVVGLVALDRNGQVLSSLFLREKSGSGSDLINQVAVADMPLDAGTETLILFASAEGTQGAAYFDNISVSEFSRSSAPAAARLSPAGKTSVIIDADRPLHPVRRELFGTNIEWIRNANDLWDPGLGRIDPDIVRMGREAGISMIRFPGGVWSDAYDWRDGVGPLASRPTTPHVPGDQEKSRHVIGTDEIVDLARSWNATLVLTVNVGHGTPEMAGEWAAYIRDKFGPQTVGFWEIGNELYMKGDLTGGSIGPDIYAERVLAFAAAIRREIPDARIAAIGLVNRDRYEFNSYPDWNEVVLARTAGVIDHYAIHNSYAPLVTTEGIRQGAQVYSAMLAAPELIARNLDRTRSLAQNAGAGTIGLSVTEWGPFFAIDPKSAYFDHVKTLGSAVFVARTLNVFLRNPAVRSAHFFKLSDVLNMGWIARDGAGGHRATPALQAFSLYANGMSGTLLTTRIDGPDFATRPTGFVSAVEAAPVIDAVASKSGDSVTVLISSADLTASREVLIDIPGSTRSWRMEQTVLSGRAPDAHNGTRMIDVPGLSFAKPQGFSGTGAFETPRTGDVTLDRTGPQTVQMPLTLTAPPHSVIQLRLTPQ